MYRWAKVWNDEYDRLPTLVLITDEQKEIIKQIHYNIAYEDDKYVKVRPDDEPVRDMYIKKGEVMTKLAKNKLRMRELEKRKQLKQNMFSRKIRY